MYYGGDKRGAMNDEGYTTGNVTETMTISFTGGEYSLWVKPYGDGKGDVVYTWDLLDNCDREFGCEPCGTFRCKDDLKPVCYGTGYEDVRCVDPSEQEPLQQQCDDYTSSEEYQCENVFKTVDCISWTPTKNPSTTPSVGPTYSTSISPTPRNFRGMDFVKQKFRKPLSRVFFR